ncbi:MAG: hypothetical protein K0B84_03000 [Firmicutes bacterium]|nr:hypothetical protein [Bacillota bacterium]
MSRVKTLLIVSLVVVLSLSLMGCSLLGMRSAQPEITAGLESDLPGWLLLSHRSAADDNIVNPKEDPAEEEVVEEVVVAEQTPTQQPTQQQPEPSTTPPQTEQSTNTGEYGPNNPPPPGTRDYMAWFAANGAKGEYNKDMMKWYAETQGGTTQSYAAWKEEKKQEEAAGGTDGGWFDGFGTSNPSGFNFNSDDDDDD